MFSFAWLVCIMVLREDNLFGIESIWTWSIWYDVTYLNEE